MNRLLRADMHIHTYFSDGRLSPDEVAAECVKNGVEFAVITDHDCMLAYDEFRPLCDKYSLKTVGGIEVSAYENGVKIHTLGYGVDGESTVFKNFLKGLYEGSLNRAEDIVKKLNSSGVCISMQEVLDSKHSPLSPVHSMHIALACVRRGYANNAFNFYLQYLAKGKCAYSELCRPTPEEAVYAINKSGGFASLAHPGRIELEADELLALTKKLKDCGLGGIEGVYSTHTVTETAYYKELANTLNLVVTGGSDTHIKDGNKKIGTPVFHLNEALADKLKI